MDVVCIFLVWQQYVHHKDTSISVQIARNVITTDRGLELLDVQK